MARLNWRYQADDTCSCQGSGWSAVVAPAPNGGHLAMVVFDSGEQWVWPAGDELQNADHCRRWVRRLLVTTQERSRWQLRSLPQPPRSRSSTATRGPSPGTGPPTLPFPGTPADYVGASEAARLFGVTRGTVARWAKQGRLPHTRTPGGHARFLLAALEEALGVTPSEPRPLQ